MSVQYASPLLSTGPTTINMIKEEVSFRNSTQPVVVFLFQVSTLGSYQVYPGIISQSRLSLCGVLIKYYLANYQN